MPCALLQHVRMAIKMARNGGTFVGHRRLFCLTLSKIKVMLWSILINDKLPYMVFIRIISLIILAVPPPATMEAVLANIVASECIRV